MTTSTVKRPKEKRGRPGRAVLEAVPARTKAEAQRNRRIAAAYAKGYTQQVVAERYGVSQPEVSVILRNPASGTVAV